MPWPEDVAGEFPNPHPEEPAALRSDILDELHDHLLASLEHDDAAARKSVLSRFGDPSTIARRLWWDAMWGRVMLNRISIVFVILLCLCSVVATGLVWQSVQQSQQVTAALVAQVQKLAEREVSQPEPEDDRWKYLDWIPVTVKLEYENGEPVTDSNFEIALSGSNLLGLRPQNRVLTEYPDAEGLIDFGMVKPGELRLAVYTPWRERLERRLLVRPGQPVDLTFTCPAEPNPTETVVFQLDWPEEFRQQDLWVQLVLRGTSRELNESVWSSQPEHRWSVIVDPQGQVHLGVIVEESRGYGGATAMFSPEVIEHILLGTPLEGTKNMLSTRLGTFVGNPTRSLSDKFSSMISASLHALLEEPMKTLEFPTSGVSIHSLRVLRKKESDNPQNEMTSFQNLLPIDLSETPPVLTPENWTYRPSEKLLSLIQIRLEQLDAKQNPGEEGKTEAAEVSVE